MVITQYPHFIFIAYNSAKEDEKGLLEESETTWEFVGRGRFEKNGFATRNRTVDGNTDTTTGIIYAPPTFPMLRTGITIAATKSVVFDLTKIDCSSFVFKGIVADQIVGQLNTRINVTQTD